MIIDYSKNFWDINPELLDLSVFNKMYTDLGKRKSSNVMWCITKVYYPTSPIYTAFGTLEERIEEVHKTSCLEFVPNFEDYRDVILMFEKACIPTGLRFLMEWDRNLKELDVFLSEATFKSSFKDKAAGLKERPEFLRQYKEALQAWTDEQEKGKQANRGKYQESKGPESGELFNFDD